MALITDCVGYWKMDTDGSVPDSVNSNDGTIVGATFTSSGKINGAYSFDGTNDYVYFTDVSTLFGTNPDKWSVSFWYKSSNTATHDGIVNAYDSESGSDTTFPFMFYTVSANQYMQFLIRTSGTGYNAVSDVDVNDGDWHHIVGVVDKTATNMYLYVDNVLEATTAISGVVDYFDAGLMKIAAIKYNGSMTNFMNVIVDELGIWDNALSAGDVAALYNSGNGLAYPFSTGLNVQLNIGDAWKAVPLMKINIGDDWKAVAGLQINIGDAWKAI